MKNILLVSGSRIAPAVTGGQVHSISIARALARMGHTVRIFSIAGRREDYGPTNIFHASIMVKNIEPRLSEDTDLGIMFGAIQSVVRRLDYPRLWQHEFLKRGIIPKRLKHALGEADIVLSDDSQIECAKSRAQLLAYIPIFLPAPKRIGHSIARMPGNLR
jgi:hypothetical protein